MTPGQARLPPIPPSSCMVFHCLILASHVAREVLIFLSGKGDTIFEAGQGHSAPSNKKSRQKQQSGFESRTLKCQAILHPIHNQLIYEPRPSLRCLKYKVTRLFEKGSTTTVLRQLPTVSNSCTSCANISFTIYKFQCYYSFL